MTEPVDYSGVDGNDSTSTGGNPAWQEFLQEAPPPEVYEKYIAPAFTKWDQHVTKRFDQVHQQYDPWKDVIGSADPQTAGFAINLLNALNNNPREVVDEINKYYKLNELQDKAVAQGQVDPTKVEQDNDPYAKEIAQLKQQSEIMAQALLARHQQEESAKADAWVDTELARLSKQNESRGAFNEQWVCSIAAQTNCSLDEAVKKYYEWRDAEVGKYRQRPLIMPGGGGTPGAGGLNVRKMDNKQTNSLIVDLLNANNAQNQQ